ncbi:MAG: mechanosensitive ion channel [Oligoflexia bacterium]|nr:mechanosensitive ion channel [Oligoflexia bacterium]
MKILNQPWIPAERIERLVQLEPALLTIGLLFGALIFYKLFLRKLSPERHQNLRRQFRNVSFHLIFSLLMFMAYSVLNRLTFDAVPLDRITPYIGLIVVISWSTVFVKTSRILLFEYLFFNSMRRGVPLLLVNLLSLVLTLILGGWLLTEIFNIQIGPLLATSAIFSVVLGLALQDTLGNLFSGVAMQFDKPYEIGDWIEIVIDSHKWVGQVYEISWRATVLVGIGDELITVPNRLMAQTQISNFATRTRPICRSQILRIPIDAPTDKVKAALTEAAKTVTSVLPHPAPFSYMLETSDSWIVYKVVYYIEDYGKQFLIGDAVITAATRALRSIEVELAPARMLVVKPSP